jgi:hypothetical protein
MFEDVVTTFEDDIYLCKNAPIDLILYIIKINKYISLEHLLRAFVQCGRIPMIELYLEEVKDVRQIMYEAIMCNSVVTLKCIVDKGIKLPRRTFGWSGVISRHDVTLEFLNSLPSEAFLES